MESYPLKFSINNEVFSGNGTTGKVHFYDINDVFYVGEPVVCSFSVEDQESITNGSDWVGIYQIGWTTPADYVVKKTIKPEYFTTSPSNLYPDSIRKNGLIRFDPAKIKHSFMSDSETPQNWFQFVYVQGGKHIAGTSTPFKFMTIPSFGYDDKSIENIMNNLDISPEFDFSGYFHCPSYPELAKPEKAKAYWKSMIERIDCIFDKQLRYELASHHLDMSHTLTRLKSYERFMNKHLGVFDNKKIVDLEKQLKEYMAEEAEFYPFFFNRSVKYILEKFMRERAEPSFIGYSEGKQYLVKKGIIQTVDELWSGKIAMNKQYILKKQYFNSALGSIYNDLKTQLTGLSTFKPEMLPNYGIYSIDTPVEEDIFNKIKFYEEKRGKNIHNYYPFNYSLTKYIDDPTKFIEPISTYFTQFHNYLGTPSHPTWIIQSRDEFTPFKTLFTNKTMKLSFLRDLINKLSDFTLMLEKSSPTSFELIAQTKYLKTLCKEKLYEYESYFNKIPVHTVLRGNTTDIQNHFDIENKIIELKSKLLGLEQQKLMMEQLGMIEKQFDSCFVGFIEPIQLLKTIISDCSSYGSSKFQALHPILAIHSPEKFMQHQEQYYALFKILGEIESGMKTDKGLSEVNFNFYLTMLDHIYYNMIHKFDLLVDYAQGKMMPEQRFKLKSIFKYLKKNTPKVPFGSFSNFDKFDELFSKLEEFEGYLTETTMIDGFISPWVETGSEVPTMENFLERVKYYKKIVKDIKSLDKKFRHGVYSGEKYGYGGEKYGYGGEKYGYGGEKYGYGSEKYGYGGEKYGYDGEKYGYGDEKYGYGGAIEKYGFFGDKFGEKTVTFPKELESITRKFHPLTGELFKKTRSIGFVPPTISEEDIYKVYGPSFIGTPRPMIKSVVDDFGDKLFYPKLFGRNMAGGELREKKVVTVPVYCPVCGSNVGNEKLKSHYEAHF